jgi:signal transduction histidine kinase
MRIGAMLAHHKFPVMFRYIYLALLITTFPSGVSAQSDRIIDSLTRIVETTQNDSLKIEALYKLSNQYTMLDLNKAAELNKISFNLSKGKYRALGLAKSYNIKGIIHDIRGQTDSAFASYQQSVRYAVQGGVHSTHASALNNLGLLEWNKSNYVNAVNYYDRALRVFEKIGNREGQANTMSNLGMIYGTLGQTAKEKQFSFAALAIRKELNDIYGMSVSYVNIGRYYELRNDLKTAISYYQDAIRYKRLIDDKRGLAITNNNLASLLIQEQQYDDAAQYLHESVNIAQEIGARQIAAFAWYGLTSLYINKRQPALATEALKKAQSYSDGQEDNDAMITYLKHAEQIAILNGDVAAAYGFLSRRDEIEKKIAAVEVNKAVSEVEARYQNEKKEKELAREKVKVSERELKIRKQNNLLYSILLALAFVIITAYLLYKQQKIRNRQLRREAELKQAMTEIETQNHLQKQRLIISRDLHDNIGAQLTFIISSLDNLKLMEMSREKMNDKIRFLSDFTLSTIYELRDTIWAMNKKDITFEDLKIRITNFIENAQKTTERIRFDFVVEGQFDQHLSFISIDGMNIYRIIQEAVNNSLKYAGAETIAVKFSAKESVLLISIADDGSGFSVEDAESGNGMNNMRKRAKELEAGFDIQSGSSGTTITIEIPCRHLRSVTG